MRFISLFSSLGDTRDLAWIGLNRSEQLDSILTGSNKRLMIIFKHSSRCGISSMILNDFSRNYKLSDDFAELYFLDIIKDKELSKELSIRYDVVHESPQLIVIKDEKVIHHASHFRIDAKKLNVLVSAEN
jgi:bacillithiol system protein YtxJ